MRVLLRTAVVTVGLAMAAGCEGPNPPAQAPDKPIMMPPKRGEGKVRGTSEGRPSAPAERAREGP
jgi:hypothetical protein